MAYIEDEFGNLIKVTLDPESTRKLLILDTVEYVEYSDEVPQETVQWICDTQKDALKKDLPEEVYIEPEPPQNEGPGFFSAFLFFGGLGLVGFCVYQAYSELDKYKLQLDHYRVSLMEWQASYSNEVSIHPREIHFPGVHHIGDGADRQIQSMIKEDQESYTPDAELKRISMMFRALADRYSPIGDRGLIPMKVFNRVNVRFVDPGHMKKDWAGYCEEVKASDGSKMGIGIVIDINEWNKPDIDYWRREELVFHEYGHCILDLDHDDSEIILNGEKIPRTIMHHQMFSGNIYLRYREYYLTELFSHLKERVKPKQQKQYYNPQSETISDGYYVEDGDDEG